MSSLKGKVAPKEKKGPIKATIFALLEYLRQNRGYRDKLKEKKIDLEPNTQFTKRVFEELQSNPKAHYSDGCFCFQPEIQRVNNANQLVSFLQQTSKGISVKVLLEAYPGVELDIKYLVASGRIYRIPNSSTLEDYVFAAQEPVSVDLDIKRLWKEVSLPREVSEIHKKLAESGLLSDDDEGTNRVVKSRKKVSTKRRRARQNPFDKFTNNRFRRIANTHMMEETKRLRKQVQEAAGQP